jgi:hypothetical protein
MTWLLAAFLQWTSTTLADSKREPSILMSGIWQSCPEADGDYTENARDFLVNKHPAFAFHMGPRDEFSLVVGEGASEHIPHDSPRNLLGPAYHYGDVASRTGRNWSVASLGLHLNVAQMPGSHEDCYMFAVRLEKDPPPTWARRP